MITLKEYLEAINFKITGGSEYLWECYGPHCRYLDSDDNNDGENTYSVSAVFNCVNQTVYAVELWDYVNGREYRWINPAYVKAHADACAKHDVGVDESSDDRKFINLDVPGDILEKISKVVAGEPYDTRVQIEVDFSDEDLLKYMKLAHQMDISFNELVEQALQNAIDEVNAGRLTKEDAQKWLEERNEN